LNFHVSAKKEMKNQNQKYEKLALLTIVSFGISTFNKKSKNIYFAYFKVNDQLK
jgi:hypothetical protein